MPSKLIYITNASLDGYIEDETGAFDWANPDQVFDIVTDLLRPVGTHLLGRRLYETMEFWDGPVQDYPPEQRAFAQVWQKAEKIIFSRTLTGVTKGRMRIERDFDLDAIRRLKRDSKHDAFIGGAELAGLAFKADLVDECHVFLHPMIVGGGKPAFPDALQQDLELLETRPLGAGVVHTHYRIKAAGPNKLATRSGALRTPRV